MVQLTRIIHPFIRWASVASGFTQRDFSFITPISTPQSLHTLGNRSEITGG
jgi:hypothetical protein